MRLIYILSILLISNFVNAQEIELTIDSDTAYWQNWNKGIAEQINVLPINESTYEYEFRYWDGYKLINLWKADGELNGRVIFFIKEYLNDNTYGGRLYKSSMTLDQSSVKVVQNLLDDFQILKIPSDNQIVNWVQGLDGDTYIIETKSKTNYSFKSYWTPTAQNNLKEARMLQYFINEISNLSSITKSFEKFRSHQPFESYYNGYEGSTIITIAK